MTWMVMVVKERPWLYIVTLKQMSYCMKENPKLFCQYITSKTRTKSINPDLYKDDTKQEKTINDKEKAKIL